MLVLSRKKNESILIGDAITVTVISIQGCRVRLGIEAPDDVSIKRQEIEVIMPAPTPAEREQQERNRRPLVDAQR